MRTGVSEASDFLFTWKPGKFWPHENIRKLVETFQSNGTAEEMWSCFANRKIHPGDRAYLLKQGKPIGIFGRGTVVDNPERKPKVVPGQSLWHVLIRFEVSQGDVLWDPADRYLVDELNLPAPKKQYQHQHSGTTLKPKAAREIDNIISESLLIGRGQTTLVDETVQEVARLTMLIEQSRRPGQQLFSEKLRRNYRGKCAVTGCVTPAALEAAHISIKKGVDNNSPANGILLRSDIHALLDRLLITLNEDGTRIEASPELTDPSYAALEATVVARPDEGPPPSAGIISEHRNRFFERLRRRSANPSEHMAAAHP